MDVVFVLLPLSLVFVGVSIALFVWAVKRGQFDDLETPAVRMLFDDEPAVPPAAPEKAPGTKQSPPEKPAGSRAAPPAGIGSEQGGLAR